MCTSILIKAQDGSPIYGRTMEWGGFDLRSDLLLVPRDTTFTSALSDHKDGMAWQNQLGFIAINAVKKPFATDGMNETGLTLGVLYMPGFARYQDIMDGEEAASLNNIDLAAYILGQFGRIADIKAALPALRVVYNKDLEKAFGAPIPIHWIITDKAGDSIIVEYMDGQLQIHENKIGVLTNSPGYDWHLLNLRNYSNLQPQDLPTDREINGVSLRPFGVGSGMHGLPGDSTPPSRFIRAVAFTQTMLPFADAAHGVQEAGRIMHNFDIPRGLVREGQHGDKIIAGYTQWTVIGDIRKKRDYYWTEFNRRMRMVDLSKLDFSGNQVLTIPLDKVRSEDIKERTADFS